MTDTGHTTAPRTHRRSDSERIAPLLMVRGIHDRARSAEVFGVIALLVSGYVTEGLPDAVVVAVNMVPSSL